MEEDFLEVYYGTLFLGVLEAAGPEPVFAADPGPPHRSRRKAAAGGPP